LIKVSDLRVAPWDGVLEETQTNSVALGQDLVSQTNATTLAGEIVEVGLGKIKLRGKLDTTLVPLAEVRRLTFAGPKEEPGNAAAGAVQAHLVDGSSLTFALEKWGAEGVDLRSAAFGPARFRPDAFRRIVFVPAAGASNNVAK
jgi:hypothetical protein